MITLDEQLKEAKRELALRKQCYPGFVKRRMMTEGQAAYYLAAMEAIVHTLARLDMEQRQLPLFAHQGAKEVPRDGYFSR